MALDDLPDDVQVLTRDQAKARYLRDYLNRIPDADTGANTLPDHDASLFASGMMVLMNNAVVIGRATNLRGQTGERLNRTGRSEGVERPPAVAASGLVQITASAGGTTILDGDELTEPNTQARYVFTTTKLYANGDVARVESVDPGPAGNLAVGTKLVITSPRAGCAKDVIVVASSDGSGISGGRAAATDAEYIEAIEEKRRNPPANGNDAEIARIVAGIREFPFEAAFTYPAVKGPGTTAVIAMVRPARLGGERVATEEQQALIDGALRAGMQGDDNVFVSALFAEPVEVALAVTWKTGAWTDAAPWPEFIPVNQVRVKGTPTPAATAFRLYTAGTTDAPQVGQTIALWDKAGLGAAGVERQGRFRKKRLLTVTEIVPSKEWAVTVEAANEASDVSFAPEADALVSPWSDALDELSLPVLQTMAGLGPGEQFAVLYDPGRRQRRAPDPLEAWSSTLDGRSLLNPAFNTGLLRDAEVALPAVLPKATTVGVPAVSARMLTLKDLAFYAQ